MVAGLKYGVIGLPGGPVVKILPSDAGGKLDPWSGN